MEAGEVFLLLEIAGKDAFVVVACSMDITNDSERDSLGVALSFDSNAGSSEGPELQLVAKTNNIINEMKYQIFLKHCIFAARLVQEIAHL